MPWSRRRWVAVLAAGTALSLVYLYVAIVVAPERVADRITTSDAAQAAARTAERGSVRTSMLTAFVVVIGAFGAVYTARTFALNRQGQITERFTRAVDQLGEEKLAVRLGGIYALERIARESADDHRPIVYLLAAYARETSPWPPQDATKSGERPQPPEAAQEIKAIMAVLRRRDIRHERKRPIRIDLRQTNLRGLHVNGIHLIDADLSGAQLQGTELRGARLNGASLVDADLTDADLRMANLKKTDRTGATLTGAKLDGATLDEAGAAPT